MIEFLHVGRCLRDGAINRPPKAQGMKPMGRIFPGLDQIIHGFLISSFWWFPVLDWLSDRHRYCSPGASRWLSSHRPRRGLGLLALGSFLLSLHWWRWNCYCVGLRIGLGFFGGCCLCPLCLSHPFGGRFLLLFLGSNWNNRGWWCGSPGIPITKQTTGFQDISWTLSFFWFQVFLGLVRWRLSLVDLSSPGASPATPPPLSIFCVLFLLCSKAKLLPSSQNLGCGRNYIWWGAKSILISVVHTLSKWWTENHICRLCSVVQYKQKQWKHNLWSILITFAGIVQTQRRTRYT